jgi:hypothetical protein
MRVLCIFENAKGMTAQDLRVLKERALVTAAPFCVKVANVRVSPLYVQLDLLSDLPFGLEVATALERLSGKLVEWLDITHGISVGDEIAEKAMRLFNDTRYWESQEALEKLWKEGRTEPERSALQGLILAGAALVHAEKGEVDVCERMLRRALCFIEKSGLKCVQGIDLYAFQSTLKKSIRSAQYFKLKLTTCART